MYRSQGETQFQKIGEPVQSTLQSSENQLLEPIAAYWAKLSMKSVPRVTATSYFDLTILRHPVPPPALPLKSRRNSMS